MNKLCTFAGSLVGGYVGWWLCDGFGMVIAFIASGVCSALGVYLGWKLAQKIEG